MNALSPLITEKTSIATDLIVSVNEMGLWLNLSASLITKYTTLITGLIKTAVENIEKYTWLSLRLTRYLAYYELPSYHSFFEGNLKLTLERTPILELDDITKIEYLDSNDVWVEFSRGSEDATGLFKNVTEKLEQRQWTSIYFKEAIPFQDRVNAYKIRITFNAGWDVSETEEHLKIPETLKTAIKKIVAFHYINRGDCSSECDLNGWPIPCEVKGIIDLFSIANTVLGGVYNTYNDS